MHAPMHEPAFVPLDASFGARVEGIDLASPFAPEVTAALQAALDEYHLLVVHVPDLAPVGQQQLAAVFGPLLDESRDGSGYTLVSDQPGGSIREGPLLFHSDLAFTPTPLVAISLYALEIPSEGTSTHFADAVGAARRLPASTLDAVRDREAVHVYPLTDARGDRRFRVATVDRDAPRATHPVLMSHPRTGEPVLFVGQMQTDSIVGLDGGGSEALLAELWSELYAPTNVYSHNWEVGDLVVWDNLAVQHARDDVVLGAGRTLRRVPVGTYAVQLRET
jgi:taurine dioxygenase